MQSQEQQPSWLRSINKSNSNNEQLEFWRFVNIAYMCSKTNLPSSEMIKFRNAISKNGNHYLAFALDSRSKLYHDLEKNEKSEFCWFYPLTREKYRIKAKIFRFSKKDFSQKNSDAIISLEDLKSTWDAINKEEQKLFANIKPDTQTVEKSVKVHDDLADFNNPELEGISENYSLLVADVFEVEHTKFAMPQVVANSRHDKFESLFCPYKVTTKYLHRFDEKGNWETIPLNP